VDIFTRPGQSPFVFLQGHPEYEADTLLRQYCREVGRFLRGQVPEYPQSPVGYFDAGTERAFRMLSLRASSTPQAQLVSACAEIAAAARPEAPWRAPSVTLVRNWLETMTKAKVEASPARHHA
jgi:homoserine O-succinyltransferase